MLLSASRDKTLIIWNLTRDETSYGYPKRSLHGHSHIVSDCVSLWHRFEEKLALTVLIRSFPPMALMLSPRPGTRPSACGSYQPALPLDALSVTQTMCSPFPSLPITARSFLAHAIGRLSCGTPSVTANTPSQRKDTLSGYPA